MKTNRFYSTFIYYVCIFAIFILLDFAYIGGRLNPFPVAFLFALIYMNRNEYVLSPAFALSYMLVHFTLESVVIGLFTGVCAILLPLYHKIIKRKMTFVHINFYMIISQVVYAYYHMTTVNDILNTIATLIGSVMFLYMATCALSAVLSRGLYGKFAFDENICLGVIVAACALGLDTVNVYGIAMLTSVVAFLVLFLLKTVGSSQALYFATMCGVGVCFGNLSIVPLSIFVAYAAVAIAFRDAGKWIDAFAVVVTDIVIGLLLNGYADYNYLNIIGVGIGALLFCFIPRKKLENIGKFVGSGEEKYIEDVVLAGAKQEVKEKLRQTSNIFYCLGKSYKALVKGDISKTQASEAIANDIRNRICSKCELQGVCSEGGFKDMNEGFTSLANSAIAKGVAKVVDVPYNLSSSCNKIAGVLALVNEDADEYRCFCDKTHRENKGRLDVAEQFFQTSIMLEKMKNELSEDVRRNNALEKKIMEELLFLDIVTKEINVFETKNSLKNVVIVIRNSSAGDSRIDDVLKKVFKTRLKLATREFSILSGWSVLTYELALNFDVVMGVASSSLDGEQSGDTQAVSAISKSQVMAVICDGMGSGKRAGDISNTTLDIIENFYKAGFSSDFIVKSTNRFLNFSNKEIFSTVDICLIDKQSACADFIKMGSSISVVKRGLSAVKVAPESLPLGIVDRVSLKIKKMALSAGDIIVLASDGVVDSFPSEDYFVNYVNSIRLINAKLIADTILEQAKYNYNGKNRDDMTVIAIRLISCA